MEPELHNETVQRYEGEKDPTGRLHGQGRAIFRSGAVYDGEWSNGKMQGRGKLTFPDGVIYEGGFLANAITGIGAYHWPSGAAYVGGVQAGLRHGHGRMAFADSPAVYEGDWVAGLRQGKGIIYLNANRTAVYTGDWHQEQKHGVGVMQYPNGDVYEGEWQHDLKCGTGVMRWKAFHQQYDGQWAANTPNGVGTQLWLQQAAPTDSSTSVAGVTHALLLMLNRYHGHFKYGRRHGYGVLHYATGARYEGEWAADQKHGQGCFVFENGAAWAGGFVEDRPTQDASGLSFSPPAHSGVVLNISELLEEEENPSVSARAINNVFMCYNSELRTLYDKYCKRTTSHIPQSAPRPNFTLVAAQLWEMLSDGLLLTAHTSLHVVSSLLVTARQPPPVLSAFRQQAQSARSTTGTAAEAAFWSALTAEPSGAGGPFSPASELLFREFCELLLRLAYLRYRALPGPERRLHTLINVHLLPLVGKAKASTLPLPRTSFQLDMLDADSMAVLSKLQPDMQRFYACTLAQGDGVAAGSSFDPQDFEGIASAQVTTPRLVLQLLQRIGMLDEPLMTFQTASTALCHHFLTKNTFGIAQRLRIDDNSINDAAAGSDQHSKPNSPALTEGMCAVPGSKPGSPSLVDASRPDRKSTLLAILPGGITDRGVSVTTACTDAGTQEVEVACWLDAPLLYAEVSEALARCANATILDHERLAQKLEAFWHSPTGLIAHLDRATVAQGSLLGQGCLSTLRRVA